MGVDPGTRRYGVAIADPETRFARPLEVIDVQTHEPVQRIADLARELGATAIVVGRPVSLSGAAGPSVQGSDALAAALRDRVDAEVVQFDERFTSVLAEQARRAAGRGRKTRKEHVDAVAAQLMLQTYLDATPAAG